MLIKTKCFGEVDIDENMIITFDNGIIGLEDYKRYTLLYNNEDGNNSTILWLQSVDKTDLALPVVIPLYVKEDYNPIVEDEYISDLGELNDENLMLLAALTVPSDITKMTVNLKAPFIINSDIRKGAQIIVENQDYPIKYDAYSVLKKKKEEKGE